MHRDTLCVFHKVIEDHHPKPLEERANSEEGRDPQDALLLTGELQFHAVNWMKIWLIQKVLNEGFACLAVDTDMVFFENPFRDIDASADVSSSSDWNDLYLSTNASERYGPLSLCTCTWLPMDCVPEYRIGISNSGCLHFNSKMCASTSLDIVHVKQVANGSLI